MSAATKSIQKKKPYYNYVTIVNIMIYTYNIQIKLEKTYTTIVKKKYLNWGS